MNHRMVSFSDALRRVVRRLKRKNPVIVETTNKVEAFKSSA